MSFGPVTQRSFPHQSPSQLLTGYATMRRLAEYTETSLSSNDHVEVPFCSIGSRDMLIGQEVIELERGGTLFKIKTLTPEM